MQSQLIQQWRFSGFLMLKGEHTKLALIWLLYFFGAQAGLLVTNLQNLIFFSHSSSSAKTGIPSSSCTLSLKCLTNGNLLPSFSKDLILVWKILFGQFIIRETTGSTFLGPREKNMGGGDFLMHHYGRHILYPLALNVSLWGWGVGVETVKKKKNSMHVYCVTQR